MSDLQRQIAEKVRAKLAESASFDPTQLDKLRDLLCAEKKVKPDELVRVLTSTRPEAPK